MWMDGWDYYSAVEVLTGFSQGAFGQRRGPRAATPGMSPVRTSATLYYTNGTGEYDPNHPTQFEYLLMAKENFGIDRLHYDGTRGEFDAIADADRMPPEFEAVIFTKKRMVAMASNLSDRMTQHTVEMRDDQRQKTQLLAVNNTCKRLRRRKDTWIVSGPQQWPPLRRLRGRSSRSTSF